MPHLDTLEEDFLPPPSRSRSRLLFYAAGWFLYLPLATLFGWLRWFPAGRAYAPAASLRTLLYLVFFLGAFHLFVAWPVLKMAYPQRLAQMSRSGRILILSVLLALPLTSFGWYLSAGQGLETVLSLALTCVPLAFLAAVFFEVTGEDWVVTFVLGGGAFISFFLVNDVMDGLPVLLNFGARNASFYALRTLWVIWFTGLAACLELGIPRRRSTLVLLALANAFICSIWLLRGWTARELTAWLFCAASLLLLKKSSPRLAVTAAAVVAAVSFGWLGWQMVEARYDGWLMLRGLFHATTAFVACVWITALGRELRPSFRPRFLRRAQHQA